jgi:hypothetical protein
LTWNGEAFSVQRSEGSIAARAAKAEPITEAPEPDDAG